MAPHSNAKAGNGIKPKKTLSSASENQRKKEQKKAKKQAKSAAAHPGSKAQSPATGGGSDTDGDADGETDDERVGAGAGLETIEERVVVESPKSPCPVRLQKLAMQVFGTPEIILQIFKHAAGQAVRDVGPGPIQVVTANRIETREYLRLRAIHRKTYPVGTSCFMERVSLSGHITKSAMRQEKIGAFAAERDCRTPEVQYHCYGRIPANGNLFGGLENLKGIRKFVFNCQQLFSEANHFSAASLFSFPFDPEGVELVVIPHGFLWMQDCVAVVVPSPPIQRLTLGSLHFKQTLPNMIESAMRQELDYAGLNFNDAEHADFLSFAARIPNAPNLREVEFMRAVGLATIPALSVAPNLEVLTFNTVMRPSEMEQLTGKPKSGSFPNLKVL
ncbi:hypothetical protein RQP46_004244 [Phenoliferia psychrophenolica]